MKTNTKLLLLVCAVILSSCAGKFGVMKRRYNKGFYVSVRGDKAAGNFQKQRLSNATKTDAPKDELIAGPIHAETAVTFAPKTEQAKPISKNNQHSKQVSADAKNQLIEINKTIKALPKITADKKRQPFSSSGSGDSDTNTILLVILAIFIPPLAVYLKDKAVSKWFWITLILSIVGIFGFALLPGIGGLAWLLAVIFAILYVLDVLK